MILYYSIKFHFIIINSFRVIGRGHFPPPPPPPQAVPPSKSPGGIGLKHAEPVSLDFVNFKIFVWSLTVLMPSTNCIKTIISLVEKDRGGVVRPVKPFKSCILIMIIIVPIRLSFG